MARKQINIGAGITWDVVHGPGATSYLPPGAATLPRNIGKALRQGDPNALLRHVSPERVGNSGTAVVRPAAENSGILVKFSREPFSHIAVNALLERAWDRNPRINTPHYLGHLVTPEGSATIMSRVEGTQLADLRPGLSVAELEMVGDQVKSAGQVALAGFGVDPGLLAWDLNSRNIIQNSAEGWPRADAPLTVIDQTAAQHMDADQWSDMMLHHNGPARDLRDIAASQATGGQDAFDRFFAGV